MSTDVPPTSTARRMTAYSFLAAFANDGTLDEKEVLLLEKIALEDGIVDKEEKRVLSLLFSRVSEKTTTARAWAEIQRVREAYGVE